MFKIGASVERKQQIVVRGKDIHPRIAGIGGQPDRPPVSAINGEGVLGIGIAVGIMGVIFQVAVDIARLEAEFHLIREVMGDEGRALQGTTGIAVPARLPDKCVAIQLRARHAIGQECPDDRQELRRRSGIVLLIQAGQNDVGGRRGLPADRRRDHDAVVGDMIDERVGVARPPDKPDSQVVGDREVDVAQRFLAIIAAVDEVYFAACGEIRRLRHKVHQPADRTLPEQDRSRTAQNFDAGEIIGVRRDRRIIREDVPHAVAKLQGIQASNGEAIDPRVPAIGIGEHTGGIFYGIADTDRALRQIAVRIDDSDGLRRLNDRRVRLGAGILGGGDHDRVAVHATVVRRLCVASDRCRYRHHRHGG